MPLRSITVQQGFKQKRSSRITTYQSRWIWSYMVTKSELGIFIPNDHCCKIHEPVDLVIQYIYITFSEEENEKGDIFVCIAALRPLFESV